MKIVRGEEGLALILVMMASALLIVLGSSLVLETMTDSTISSNYRDGITALYAAEAGAGVAMARLVTATSWTPQPGFVSGTLDELVGGAPPASSIRLDVGLLDAGASDRIVVLSRAGGPGKAQRTVRVTVARPADVNDHLSLRTVAWEEVR